MPLRLALALLAASSPIYPDELEQLYAQLDRCVEAARAVVEDSPLYDPSCTPIVGRLLENEGAEESRLWQAFDALPPDTYLRRAIVHGLLDRRVELALSRLPEPKPAAEVVTGDASLEELLVQARAVHEAVRAAVVARLRSARGDLGELSYQPEDRAFEATLTDYVRRRLSLKAAESAIARYIWGSWCGTGADAMTGPQQTLVLLRALQDSRWDAAAGSLGGSSNWWRYLGWELRGKEPKRRLLALAGVDWELHEVGAALAGDPTAYRSLGRHGSDRAARLLIAALQPVSVDEHAAELPTDPAAEEKSNPTLSLRQLLPALAAFVTPKKGCEPMASYSIEDVFRVSPATIPETTQRQILELLARHVAPTRGAEEADTASRLLVRLCRTESRDVFRSMLESPFGDVRKRGLDGLRALGDDPGPQAELKPVQFEITVDGSPFAERSIAWEAEGPRGRSQTGYPQSDERGGFTVNSDVFVDPTARVEGIVVGAGLKEPTDAWFRVEMPRPAKLDDVIGVRVETQRLTVRLAENVSEADAAGMKLELSSAVRRYGLESFPQRVASLQSLSHAAPIVFERLQRGRRYRVTVSGPGDRVWTSDEILLERAPAVIVVPPR